MSLMLQDSQIGMGQQSTKAYMKLVMCELLDGCNFIYGRWKVKHASSLGPQQIENQNCDCEKYSVDGSPTQNI